MKSIDKKGGIKSMSVRTMFDTLDKLVNRSVNFRGGATNSRHFMELLNNFGERYHVEGKGYMKFLKKSLKGRVENFRRGTV